MALGQAVGEPPGFPIVPDFPLPAGRIPIQHRGAQLPDTIQMHPPAFGGQQPQPHPPQQQVGQVLNLFMGGAMNESRFYSRVLALQIRADLEGLLAPLPGEAPSAAQSRQQAVPVAS